MHKYLTDDFLPRHVDPNAHSKRRTSALAYDIDGLIRAARLAAENDTSGIPHEERGIETTLEVVGYMMGDLIERCEDIERRLGQTGDA